ncbi:MAG: DUF411 domain-containing protein [Acidimicrobiia bacterium]
MLLLIAAALLVSACSPPHSENDAANAPREADLSGVAVEVHKAVGCECCDRWAAYLRAHDAEAVVQADPQLGDLRSHLGVPARAASCHTATIGGYAVEGHVPAPAIVRLLVERPDAVGIAVPGMPLDAPGMGDDAAAWASIPVLLIELDGELRPFDY